MSNPKAHVRIKTLKPPQTYVTVIVPNKHLNQIRTSNLDMNLFNNHHRCTVIPLLPVESKTLLSKFFLKTILIILEAVYTTCALILNLTTQNYTDIDLWKKSLQPLFCVISISHFLQPFFFCIHNIHYFLFSRHTQIKPSTTISNKNDTNTKL